MSCKLVNWKQEIRNKNCCCNKITWLYNGKIETKLYRNLVSKSNYYLNYFSSHPSSTHDSIPYSLALRVVRNCSLDKFQGEALEELKIALIKNSCYPTEVVESAFSRAKAVPRKDLLKPREKEAVNDNEVGRSVLSTPFHPSLRPLTQILRNKGIT
jgi:hypothetical protein